MKAQTPLLLILIWGIGISTAFAQHALIRTAHPLPQEIAANLAIDHHLPAGPDSTDWVASRDEIAYLRNEEIGLRILQDDMQRHYAQQLQSAQPRTACGLQHYSSGSMGGYHTYQEVLNQLNLMHQLYPSLCGTPYSIGQSVEGNPIMAIKLSDQPQLNQSPDEPRVYLDALTHAREPLSMESLLAFAWWLLEHYGQDEQATYLLEEREIYLLPMVNPDGYRYNQQIAPTGGGMWRKNRRSFGANNCVGVDLNRNYPLAWSDPNGASDQVCSETFRGDSAISEPESQAVKAMIDSLGASAAMSVHSFGQVMIHPWLWQNAATDFDLSTELASDFIDPSFRAYGSGPQMLGYRASGTTSDYLQDQHILNWTPEVGLAFWEPANLICERVNSMRQAYIHLAWLAGGFARIANYQHGPVLADDTLGLSIRIINRGLGDSARNVQIQCRSLHPDLEVIDELVNLGDIGSRQKRTWSAFPIRLYILPGASERLRVEISVRQGQNATLTQLDTLYFLPQQVATIYEEGFENGDTDWNSWGSTSVDPYQGQFSLSDSPNDLQHNRNLSIVSLDSTISIPDFGYPELSFWHKYSLRPNQMTVRLQISQDGGVQWEDQVLASMQANNSGQYHWTGHQYWREERLDLSPYLGKLIRLRWVLDAANTDISSDGYYLDEVKIRIYNLVLSSLEADNEPSLHWLGFDGQWPMAVDFVEPMRDPIQIEYLDVMGRSLLWRELVGASFGERLDLPHLHDHQGPLLIMVRQGGQIIAQRWTMLLP